jgi:hypothetical protein
MVGSKGNTTESFPVKTGTAITTGRALARLLKASTAAQRALVAADIIDGRLNIVALTQSQVATLCGSSSGYVSTAAHLNARDRSRVRGGVASLATYHLNNDANVKRMIEHLGADRVFDLLDELTQPVFPAFAEAAE